MAKINWHALKFTEVFEQLGATKEGLTNAEAKARLQKYGPNVLPEDKRPSIFSIFWRQLRSPMVYVLLIAALITAVLREFVDMGVILAAVVVNAAIGFWQEWKADEAFAALKAMVQHKARVIRQGSPHLASGHPLPQGEGRVREMLVDASEIVPGDILLLHAGDRISADARLLEVFDFEVNEAALTGESLPVAKHTRTLQSAVTLVERANMVWQGTTVTRGKAIAVVVATGKETAFGEIALLVQKVVEPITPLQSQLHKLAKILGMVTVLIAVGIFGVGILQGRSIVEIFLIAVAVAVAAIPEGLLISLTVILALGMRALARRSAIVKRLLAAETLGSVSIICTDKTGTLTTGEMEVVEIVDAAGVARPLPQAQPVAWPRGAMHALEIAIVGNEGADLTSKALLRAGIKAGLDPLKLNRAMPEIDAIPFDSARKWAATLHKSHDGNLLYVRGAPEKVIAACKMTAPQKHALTLKLEKMAEQGMRILAVAYREVESAVKTLKDLEHNALPPDHLTFVAFLGMKDPLRENTRETVEVAKNAGIRTVMITGDHAKTAAAIGAELGLTGEVLTGEQMDALDDEALAQHVGNVSMFARVLPKHKVRIIDAFHKLGKSVAMTGDGVNDAPALKAADIGIAVGSGTDVAKEAADVVLLDNNFKTIVGAVEGGRTIYENVKKVVAFLLSTSWKEIIIVAGSLLLGMPLPVLAAQILWINLIEDSFPSMALAFDPAEPGLMTESPRKRNTPLLDLQLRILIFGVGITASLLLFSFYYYLFTKGYDIVYIRTMIFVGLGINTLFTIYSIRSLHRFMWTMNPLTNKYLLVSVLVGIVMLVGAVYIPFLQHILRTVPLRFDNWLPLIGLGIVNIALIELVKAVFIVRRKNHQALVS